MTEHIRRLEQIGHATWPSLEDEWLNGWLLRAGGGVTRRSNSANPFDDHDVDLGAQVDLVEAWFDRRGLRSTVRLTPAADPEIDRRLEALGYERDVGALIMTRTIARVPGVDRAGLVVGEVASESWLGLMAKEPGRGGPKRAVLEKMLAGIGGKTGFATIASPDRVRAIGLGVVSDDHLALFMMRTEEGQRRQGLGRAIAAGLMEWGIARGATEAFLQVRPDNPPALALYHSLGFEEQYEYWYRQK